MEVALTLLVIQGLLGAADTLYYHEYRARLPARPRGCGGELRLHAARDFIYAILYATLPVVQWQGALVGVLAALLLAEIVITLTDFVVEDTVRKPLGGVYPGERAMHTVIAILYGAMLGHLVPVMARWWHLPTGLEPTLAPVPPWLRLLLFAMAVGVLLAGVRDALAAAAVRGASWPWGEVEGGAGQG